MLARGVEGAPKFRPQPYWGLSLDSEHTKCTLILAYGAQWFFNGNFFIYRLIRVNLSGIFALAPTCLKVK